MATKKICHIASLHRVVQLGDFNESHARWVWSCACCEEQEGEQRGEQRGRLQEARSLITRLLKKRFGELPLTISSEIENLTIEGLESLGEDFLDFHSLEDLSNWLEKRFVS